MTQASEPNRYAVAVDGSSGWVARILDPDGAVVSERACADEDEARLYASTVSQHIGWLSEAQFRRYYRLDAAGEV